MVSAETNITIEKIWQLLGEVADPEVPVLSIVDLGIVRDVKTDDAGIEIIITPTYSGCPAMDMIAMNIKLAMVEKGYKNVRVNAVLSPAWTTDWMSENGKRKLKEYGIAPPVNKSANMHEPEIINCPQCNSGDTKLLSQFGSTSCKALYQCNDCKEPFDHFKCH